MPTPGPLPRRHHAPGPSWSGSRRSTAPAPSGTTSSRITARTCAPPSSTRPSLSAEPSRRAPRFLLFRILLPYESRQEEGQRRGGEDPRADESGPGQDGDAGLRDRDGQEERRQEKVHGRHAPRGPSRRRWPWARRLPRHDIPGRSVQVDEPPVVAKERMKSLPVKSHETMAKVKGQQNIRCDDERRSHEDWHSTSTRRRRRRRSGSYAKLFFFSSSRRRWGHASRSPLVRARTTLPPPMSRQKGSRRRRRFASLTLRTAPTKTIRFFLSE
mmetsp:Transcript_18571/g.59969  ORF Transcript_18571/g.59969 Transcript_18571/m.59969 type:complete len:271 (+) Transcript_18571:1159-1971(+)